MRHALAVDRPHRKLVEHLEHSKLLGRFQVEAQRVDYPGRDRDVRSMNDYLAEGRYDMVIYKADNILEQQNNLR